MTYPLWIVWNPDGRDEGPDDGHKFRASDAQDAAQQWAHRAESEFLATLGEGGQP